MKARIVQAVLAVSLLVALVACTESPTVTRLPEGTASTPAAQPTVQTTADLPASRRARASRTARSRMARSRRFPAACLTSWSHASAVAGTSGWPVSAASR